jgi:hypothetical protein
MKRFARSTIWQVDYLATLIRTIVDIAGEIENGERLDPQRTARDIGHLGRIADDYAMHIFDKLSEIDPRATE